MEEGRFPAGSLDKEFADMVITPCESNCMAYKILTRLQSHLKAHKKPSIPASPEHRVKRNTRELPTQTDQPTSSQKRNKRSKTTQSIFPPNNSPALHYHQCMQLPPELRQFFAFPPVEPGVSAALSGEPPFKIPAMFVPTQVPSGDGQSSSREGGQMPADGTQVSKDAKADVPPDSDSKASGSVRRK